MSNLSTRAITISLPSPSTVIWDVLDNLWDPVYNASGFVSLGVAENALMHNELATRINAIADLPTTALTYGDGPTGSKRLKAALASFLTEGLKSVRPLESAHIVVTSGVTAAIEHASWALCNAGEGMLLGRPHYGAFLGDIEIRPGTLVVPVAFNSIDPISPDCVTAYRNALVRSNQAGPKIRALMLCNPHNPLGRCYSRATLVALMALCAEYSIHLISDEIYAFSTWSNTIDRHPAPSPFTSVLSIDPAEAGLDPSQIHVLWGLSKDFGANGLRVGCIISQSNPSFLSAIRTVALHSAPSSLADHVAATLLEDSAFMTSYIRTNQTRLADSYAFVAGWAKRYSISYAAGANSAFFLWCDFSSAWRAKHRDDDKQETLTVQIMAALMSRKVFLASGHVFGSEREGWFRIVFSQPREYLEEGLRRIVQALGLEKTEKTLEERTECLRLEEGTAAN